MIVQPGRNIRRLQRKQVVFEGFWWMPQSHMATAPSICKQSHLKGMALVFGGQSTRGLLYLQAWIPSHMAIRDATYVHMWSREPSTTIE